MAASSSDFFKKARRKYSTRIGTGGITSASTTIPLQDITGVDTDTGVILVIDAMDSAGNLTPEKEEVVAGVVSGSTLVGCLRGLEGTTPVAHLQNAVVTMYFTESHWDGLINGILVGHNQDGTHKNLSADLITDGTTNKAYTATEKTKLASLSTAAGDMLKSVYDTNNDGTVDNANNAFQLNAQGASFYQSRTNHTGTQTASTISDFNSAARAQTEAELVAGANVTITPGSTGATRTLTIASTGGGGTSNTTQTVAQTSHGFAVGNAIYYTGTAYAKSNASAPETSTCVGIVSAVADANNFTYITDGAITGLSGLSAGKTYYLSTTAGTLSYNKPSGNNTVSKPVLLATGTTTGIVRILRGNVNVNARTYSRLGMNFGVTGASYSADFIRHELQYLKRYVKKLRISMPSWNDTTGIANARAIVLAAKAEGFHVTYGITAAGTGHNAAYYNSWKAQVPTEAAWAASNGVDLFFIGNEEDWWVTVGGITGVTTATVRTDILSMASTFKSSYPKLTLAYSTAEGNMADWDGEASSNANWQYLDAFGLNMYNSDFTGTLNYAMSLAYAPKLFLSEWNHDTTYASSGLTDTQWKADLAARLAAIKSKGITAYFFCWDWGGSYGTSTDWGMYNGSNTYKPGITEIFEIQ